MANQIIFWAMFASICILQYCRYRADKSLKETLECLERATHIIRALTKQNAELQQRFASNRDDVN